MARQYSTRDFFRQMPNALLARYFHARDLFEDLDFAGMKETKADELFAAWLQLPDRQRNDMDAEFRDIFELSCEKGFRAIIDEAEWHLAEDPDARTEFVETLAGLSNHFERAMVTFLDHNQFWKGATRFYHADMLPYWRKRKNLPHVAAAVDDASLGELARLVRTYFHLTEGRGNNCVVEPFRRGELDYFFAYPRRAAQHHVIHRLPALRQHVAQVARGAGRALQGRARRRASAHHRRQRGRALQAQLRAAQSAAKVREAEGETSRPRDLETLSSFDRAAADVFFVFEPSA